jgi:hypothetical protein
MRMQMRMCRHFLRDDRSVLRNAPFVPARACAQLFETRHRVKARKPKVSIRRKVSVKRCLGIVRIATLRRLPQALRGLHGRADCRQTSGGAERDQCWNRLTIA